MNAATVSSDGTGVDAENVGTGSTTVTASGTVTGMGTNGSGILAYKYVDAKALTVQAATVSGGLNGILTENQGTAARLVRRAVR